MADQVDNVMGFAITNPTPGVYVHNGVQIGAANDAAALAYFNGVGGTTVFPIEQFFNRFTNAEFIALITTPAALMLILKIMMESKGYINPTNATLIAHLNAAVTAGLLTAPRVAIILNPAVASP